MKEEVLPKVAVGQQTRGGIVTAQYHLKTEWPGSDHGYSRIGRWENQRDRLSEVQMLRVIRPRNWPRSGPGTA
jgi:hypothetical protein